MTKRLLSISILTALLTGSILSTGCAGNPAVPSAIIQDVTAREAYIMVQEKAGDSGFVILDVRTPQEFTDGHIEGAVNIDFNADNFSSEISKLDRDGEYLVYCRSGNRSRGAVGIMEELGFTKIHHLSGGIIDWTGSGYPTVR